MTSTGEVVRPSRRPALDGLRGVAVLLVMASHARIPWSQAWGAVGVTVFFTLSGYLITDLLLREQSAGGSFNLRGFYYRRALRLLPALGVMLAAVALVGVFVPGYAEWQSLLGTLFYVQNWLMADGGFQHGALAHAWSLSVEEQFYLVWPLVLLAVRRRPGVGLRVAIGGTAASFLLGCVLWQVGVGAWRIYNGLDTRAVSLLIGCALAYVAPAAQARIRPAWVVVGAVLVLVSCEIVAAGPVVFLLLPLLVALGTACLIRGLPRGDGAPHALTWFGTRSYGLYLWHWPVAALLLRWDAAPYLLILGVFTAPLALAELSWRYVETPARRLRDRVPGAPTGLSSALPVTTTVEPARATS